MSRLADHLPRRPAVYPRTSPAAFPATSTEATTGHPTDAGKATTVHAGARLTADQLAALAPGDAVVIESGTDVGRLRHSSGVVVRVRDYQLTVKTTGVRGGVYIERFSRQNGYQLGSGRRAMLVAVEADESAVARADDRDQRPRIDALWRRWSRDRDDVEAQRELHAALGDRLGVG